MKNFLLSLTVLTLLLLSTGCTGKEPTPNISDANMTTEQGVVQSVKKIETRNSGVGTMIGGALGSVGGSIAGSNVGSGTGRVLTSVLGSVLGSIAGGTVGNNITKNYSQNVTVKLSNGQTTKVVLKIDSITPELSKGQEVNVFYHEGKIIKIIEK